MVKVNKSAKLSKSRSKRRIRASEQSPYGQTFYSMVRGWVESDQKKRT